MPSYVMDPTTLELVDKATYYATKAARTPSKAADGLPTPYVRGDLPAYVSPITGKPIEGRAARREDLARSGCREVDPSECKPTYRNYEFCQDRRLPYLNDAVPPPMTKDEKAWSREKKQKAKAQEKLFDLARAKAAGERLDPDAAMPKRGNPRDNPLFKLNTAKVAPFNGNKED
jgi:hypothetical protein